MELVDLRLVDCRRNGGNSFLSVVTLLPLNQVSRTPKLILSAPHKVKAYADDLSIISDSIEEHTEMVQTIDQLSRKIDLMIYKGVTLVFDRKKS